MESENLAETTYRISVPSPELWGDDARATMATMVDVAMTYLDGMEWSASCLEKAILEAENNSQALSRDEVVGRLICTMRKQAELLNHEAFVQKECLRIIFETPISPGHDDAGEKD